MPQGTVVKIVRGKYFVNIKGQDLPISAILPGKLKRDVKSVHSIVCVGDIVAVDPVLEEWVISKIFERKNKISRISPQNRNEERVLVANIDQMLIVASVKEPDLNARLIDRYLVVAAKYDIKPIVILNKVDLLEPDDPLLEQTYKRFENTNVKLCKMSIMKNTYRNNLVNIVRGSVNAVVGSSGVGKSSIINFLDDEFNIRVGDISQAHNKGKHTTTSIQMFYLKALDAYIVDTPGIREFGLFGISLEELSLFFPEFTPLADGCKFYNCTHLHEPGCEILKAVEKGEIDEDRYIGYKNIYYSIENEFTGY